jgi:hypothetical protein
MLGRGADLNWIPPWEELTSLDAAQRSGATSWWHGCVVKVPTPPPS